MSFNMLVVTPWCTTDVRQLDVTEKWQPLEAWLHTPMIRLCNLAWL